MPNYPCVPGHEIVGKVTAVGAGVTKYAVGDVVGVGCMVGSCRTCDGCGAGLEQYCTGSGRTLTYNTKTEKEPAGECPRTCVSVWVIDEAARVMSEASGGSHCPQTHSVCVPLFPIFSLPALCAGHTMGGYSQSIVVDQDFVLKVTHSAEQLAAVAPLLCAGITVYSPLKHWGAGPGKKVGIVGIGGLGHMGVKLAKALGAHTIAFTTSQSKKEAALALGADEVVLSTSLEEMGKHTGSFDFILSTVCASHSLDPYVALLKRDSTLCLVGAPSTPHPSPAVFPLIMGRRSIAGSLIGGIPETQEMLDFCSSKGITADIEVIAASAVEEAYERMLKSDVKYRFVIDCKTLA